MQRQESLVTDLRKPIRLQELKTDLFLNDDAGNTIVVTVTDGGEPCAITGDVVCYMIRPDTTTITINGAVLVNQAIVTLPKEAYYFSGRASFVIKSEASGNKITLAAFTALIYHDRSDRITDEERIIPSLSEVMEIVNQINDMTVSVQTLAAGSDATASLTSVDGHYNIALGIPRGISGAEPDVQAATLLAANWGNSEPPTQTLSVSGITSASHIIVGIADSITNETYIQAALARILCTGADTGTLTFTAYGVTPTVDIPLTVINLSESAAVKTDYYGVCSTGASTAAKEVTIPGITALTEGLGITVKFSNNQSYNGAPTLNVNGLGAVNIRRLDGTNAARYEWIAGEVLKLVYDGTYWVIENGGIATTTYYGDTKLTTSATSESEALALTPKSLNSLALNMIAGYPVYSTSATYEVGARVRYGYNIYKCRTAITTGESWTASHWEALPALQVQLEALEARIAAIENN